MLPAYFTDFEPVDNLKTRTLVSSEKILILEKSTVFSVVEKVHLVSLLLGYQQICDIGVGQAHLEQYENELHALSIAFQYANIASGERWLIAGCNRAVLKYIEAHWEKLSEIEAGIFYGYPATSTLAFSQILKSRTRKPETAAAFYLGGIYSEEYFDEEEAHLERVWLAIQQASPRIANGANSNYKNIIEQEKGRLF